MAEVDLRQALDVLADAVVACDGSGVVAYANDAAARFLGRSRKELVGASLAVLAAEHVRVRYAGLLARFLRAGVRSAGPVRLVAERGDGMEIDVEVCLRPVASGGFVVSLRDAHAEAEVTRQVSLQRQLKAAASFAAQVTSRFDRDRVAKVAARALARGFGAALGAVWLVDPKTKALVARAQVGLALPPEMEQMDTSEGWAAETLRSREPLFIADARTDPRFDLGWAREAKVRSVAILPLVVEGEVQGIMVAAFRRAMAPGAGAVLTSVAAMMAASLRDVDLFLERTAMQEELRASEHRLSTTLRSIADAVIATDVSGRITFMNSVAEVLTDWSFAEARGLPLTEVFCAVNEDDDRSPIENPVARVIRDGLVVGLASQTALISRSGVAHSIEDSAAPIRNEKDELLGVVMVFRDVTQLRRADRRRRFLAQAAATLASSLDYSQTLKNVAHLAVPRLADWCVVHIVEDERVGAVPLTIAHVNPAKVSWARALQERYPADPGAMNGLANVLRSNEPELYAEVTDELLARGASDAEHLRLLRQLGPKSVMMVPLVAHGRSIGAITFVNAESAHRYDQADLAMAEELATRAALAIDNARLHRSLQEGEERTRLVLESAGEAIIGVDLRGCCIFANPACAAMLGYSSQEDLLGKDVRDLAHAAPESSRGGRAQVCRIDELCLDEEPAHVAEERLGRLDGTTFWAECWSHPIRRAGARVGAVISFVDITDRKRAQQEHERLLRELEEAVRLRDDFLSIASHELRTPLTPLRLHVQGIQRALARGPLDAITPAEILKRLESVARQITRIERLIDDLLDIGHITSKRMVLQAEELDLGVLARDVVGRYGEELSRARCEVRVDIDGSIFGRWDRARLDQVLTNLLLNAMKFGPGKPIDVRVSVPSSGGMARLQVRDRGIGIGAGDQRRIFERFERAVPSRHYGGFGLGLWIVRQIVDAMGGTVAVESALGEGATFTVEVPIRAVAAPTARAMAS